MGFFEWFFIIFIFIKKKVLIICFYISASDIIRHVVNPSWILCEVWLG